MKVKVPLLLVLVLAMVVGYMLGTESGREKKEVILVKMGRGPESGGAEEAAADEAPAEEAGDAAAEGESADEPAEAPAS